MAIRLSILAATAAFTLAACEGTRDAGDGNDGDDTATEEVAAAIMTDSDKRQAKTQCEIAAVAQGGTAEQAKTLCDCTIDKVAEGKTAEQFNAVSDDEANAALDACAAETGIEAVK